MKKILFTVLVVVAFSSQAQRYKSTESSIRFYSKAPLEDIEATTTNSTSIVDIESRALVFVVPINSFAFKKKLMQEHFNENYLESDKYPKATFKGKIEGWDGAEGESSATAVGEMEIHGVKQEVEITGEIVRTAEALSLSAVFPIKLEDYKVKIPKAVFYNIADEVEVTIKFDYTPYEKN